MFACTACVMCVLFSLSLGYVESLIWPPGFEITATGDGGAESISVAIFELMADCQNDDLIALWSIQSQVASTPKIDDQLSVLGAKIVGWPSNSRLQAQHLNRLDDHQGRALRRLGTLGSQELS